MWEYKVLILDEDKLTSEALNALGRQGWELVSDAMATSIRRRLIFKRPLATSS